jgi:hypothetical protein
MSALRSLVTRHVITPSVLGSDTRAFDRKSLQRELAQLRRSREVAFWIVFGVVVLLVILAVAAAIGYRTDPQLIRKLSTASGVTIMGSVALLVRLWGQKVRSDLVLAIVSGMSEDGVKAALTSLVNRL